jgi:hypothetical protein
MAVLNRSVPSAVSDTGATSHAFLPSTPLIPTNTILTAMFHLPDGAAAAATKIHKLHHKLHEPEHTVNIVPSLVGNSLLSTVKMVQAGYTAIYSDSKVNFYDSTTAKTSVSEAAVLTGCVCPRTQLWCVPLVTTVRNENTDTLLLNHPRKHESLNAAYTMESTSITQAHINSAMSVARGNEYIHNVYKLPSIEPTIRYLHAAAGFPTKESWSGAIRQGNYNSWPLINVKNVARHFLESEETQKGHMRGQRQCVHSTKTKQWDTDVTSCPIEPSPQITPHICKGDIMIFDYNLKSTMYTNQTGLFPQISSLGNRYVMILPNVDSNLSWGEALKDNTGGKLILA